MIVGFLQEQLPFVVGKDEQGSQSHADGDDKSISHYLFLL
jgi:hypothetical protein